MKTLNLLSTAVLSLGCLIHAAAQGYYQPVASPASATYQGGSPSFNVGIGTTTLFEKFNVNGNALVSSNAATTKLLVQSSATANGTTAEVQFRHLGTTLSPMYHFLNFKPNSGLSSEFALRKTDGASWINYFRIFSDNSIVFNEAGAGYSYGPLAIKNGNFYVEAGSVGIGTASPLAKLHVAHTGGSYSYGILLSTTTAWAKAIAVNNGGADQFVVYGNGQVRIGHLNIAGPHINPRLSVDGKIVCKEVVVTTDNWADYVFDEDYDLPTLGEIRTFIEAEKHLPGIPSADEVKAEGVSLGSMDALLLKKIEELTLYILQQEKRIKDLESCTSN